MKRNVAAILAIPEIPYKNIVWLVYDEDMVSQVESLFVKLRGQYFFDTYITVSPIGKKLSGNSFNYYDPNLYDLIGNGTN